MSFPPCFVDRERRMPSRTKGKSKKTTVPKNQTSKVNKNSKADSTKTSTSKVAKMSEAAKVTCCSFVSFAKKLH